jgi:hypothetical protein
MIVSTGHMNHSIQIYRQKLVTLAYQEQWEQAIIMLPPKEEDGLSNGECK